MAMSLFCLHLIRVHWTTFHGRKAQFKKMSKIFTPTNQIRLTNVAVVRLKRTGKRFEIACYKNKVLSWRNNIEKDIEEVLQTHTIFANVSKGQVAKKEDVLKAFGDLSEIEICKMILQKGELQVSDKERQSMLDSQWTAVVNGVTELCINPETRHPYPASIIEKSLKETHFSLKPNRNVKQQTLEAIKLLKQHLPLERSRMKLRVCLHLDQKDKIESLKKLIAEIESSEQNKPTSGMLELIILIDPGHLRQVESLVRSDNKSKDGIMELLEIKEVVDKEIIF